MKQLILPFLFVLFTQSADAQNYDWFKGNWYGVKSFTGARIGIRVLVRIEVDSVRGSRFAGRFVYMYPKDTIARLVKTFSGNIKGKNVSLNKSREIYLLDPLSRSFWSNCSTCNETASLSLNDSDLVFKITTTNCGDSCNGETVFLRNVYSYDPLVQAAIKKLFTKDKPAVALKTNSKQKNKNSRPVKISLADTTKINQSFTKLSNKQANGANNSSKNVTSTQTIQRENADSIAPATVHHNTPGIAIIDPAEKKRNTGGTENSLIDTINAGQSLTRLNTATIMTAGTISKTDTLAQLREFSDKDSLQKKISRETELVSAYQVDSPHIHVDLFDNGPIDYDIVSVYYNGNLIINHHTLSDTAIAFTIDASATNRHHEFIMIAENEGLIPPNSALLRIRAGHKQFKIPIRTSSTKNVKIAIDYVGE